MADYELNAYNIEQLSLLKALADPIRLKILKYLKEKGESVTCGEVGEVLGISKTNGSYHFKMLEETGLIIVKKVSREKFISLNEGKIKEFTDNLYKSL